MTDPAAGPPSRRAIAAGAVAATLGVLAAAYFLRLSAAPAELKIALGFFVCFIAPGWFFMLLFFPERRPPGLEAYPAAIALSLGVWSAPGLIGFATGASLEAVIAAELGLLAALMLGALARAFLAPPPPVDAAKNATPPGGWLPLAAVTLAVAGLSIWIGGFRGQFIDFDYFNYISHVNKLVSWDRASAAHFAYKNVPPDPIHSYNIWALQWALIAKLFALDPIVLYRRSVFLTAPAAVLAFHALARQAVSAAVARTAALLYASYHVLYAGLIYLGLTSFFPDDSQWLVVFPAVVALFLALMEKKSRGLLFGLALAALGMSIVHVLWGLCLYVVIGLYWLVETAARLKWGQALTAAWRGGGRAKLISIGAWLALPLGLAAATSISMWARDDLVSHRPLLGFDLAAPAWLWASLFVGAPLAGLAFMLYRARPPAADLAAAKDGARRVVVTLAVLLAVAAPYVWLRSQAIEATDWGQFGRNPYRAFVTASVFFLNPFQLSLDDPNMTFYPLYLLGWLALPLVFRRSTGAAHPRLVLAVMAAVPLICFNPALASLFADLFSLGYLRRFLKLAAPFSILPAAVLVHWLAARIADPSRRSLFHAALGLALSAALAGLCVFFPAQPAYYNRMLSRALKIARTDPHDSLLQDDTPYRLIKDHGWFAPDDVIFSDFWTGYRLTAYLPQYVAVQQKPGVGVKDQGKRRLFELEFFNPRTRPERRREILDYFQAAGVIVNRSPAYRLSAFGMSFDHPEIIAVLKQDPEHFEVLHDQGDWTIFRRKK